MIAKHSICPGLVDMVFKLLTSPLAGNSDRLINSHVQDCLECLQEDNCENILLNVYYLSRAEDFSFEMLLEPEKSGFDAPAFRIQPREICYRIFILIEQRSHQDFGFTRGKDNFHESHTNALRECFAINL